MSAVNPMKLVQQDDADTKLPKKIIKKKVCMVGAFSVGKTSLVHKYVHSIFSEKYLTTVGVKIDNKEVDVDGQLIQLLLWDIQGEDELTRMRLNYLKGASAMLLVVDGTRRDTLYSALSIKALAEASSKQRIPSIILFNKSDLLTHWEITDDIIDMVQATGLKTMFTSAKNGSGVEEAFLGISRIIMES